VRGARLRLAVVAAAALPGCWVPIERGRQMEARIQRLEVQGVEQQRTMDEQREVVRDRVAKMDQKIQEVQTKIDELNQAARRSGADLGVQLGRLQEEFARVKGDLEVAQHKLAEVEKGVTALDQKTEGRFAALKGAGALDEFEAKKKLESIQRPTDKAAFLDLARDQETKGEKAVARALYDEFVRKWPADPRAADAHFRLGELWYGDRRYRDAILEYGKVAQDFPRSDKAPDALLRTAESMIEIDLKDDAKAILADIPRKYPNTSAATRAKARLAELTQAPKRKSPPPKR
jgi:tol-pal system protein YbgF